MYVHTYIYIYTCIYIYITIYIIIYIYMCVLGKDQKALQPERWELCQNNLQVYIIVIRLEFPLILGLF